MFHRVLNMPLDYRSCFAMALREIHENVDMVNWLSYSLQIRIFPLILNSCSKVQHSSKQKVNKSQRVLIWCFCSFIFFIPMPQAITKVVHAIFYMQQTSGACAGICTCNRMHQMDKLADPAHLKMWD